MSILPTGVLLMYKVYDVIFIFYLQIILQIKSDNPPPPNTITLGWESALIVVRSVSTKVNDMKSQPKK